MDLKIDLGEFLYLAKVQSKSEWFDWTHSAELDSLHCASSEALRVAPVEIGDLQLEGINLPHRYSQLRAPELFQVPKPLMGRSEYQEVHRQPILL